VRALLERLAETYKRAKISGSEEFWAKVTKIDQRLGEALKPRPIGDLEINTACQRANEQFIEACKEERK